jgi:hypothetical protein
MRAATTQIPTKGSAIISFMFNTMVASFFPRQWLQKLCHQSMLYLSAISVEPGLGQGAVVLPFFP